jgi:hypothetical protein
LWMSRKVTEAILLLFVQLFTAPAVRPDTM